MLDGYSRYLVHWELRESMKNQDVATILQRAREKHPGASPRIISDRGPQFIAREFKDFIRISGMTHVLTSPYYPQSNGKVERYHGSLERESIRPGTPLTVEDARRLVTKYVNHYNGTRPHSAIGYVSLATKLAGREGEVFRLRDERLDAAREKRKAARARRATA